jgi:ATP-dependent DNA helicase PIF1
MTDINVQILKRLPGETCVYDAADFINFDLIEEGDRPNIFTEFLRAQNPSGLPPARLELKIEILIICLRNLFLREGLCNGTRMIVTKLREYFIKIRIISGQFYGEDRAISRIILNANMGEGAWQHNRKQFLVRLYFAITINKTKDNRCKR